MAIAVNHVAVTVTDINEAAGWYSRVLDFELLAGPILIDVESDSNSETALRMKAIFGAGVGKFWMCHMLSSNRVGIELFEFVKPKSQKREDNFEYWKTGFFHLCITDAQITQMAEKIAAAGGKMRTRVFQTQPGKQICFCEDPFGNVIEIYSHAYEDFWRSPASAANRNETSL